VTTATGTAQDSTLYGPDGRPFHRPATTPAGRTPSPAPSAGEWQPVAVQGTATVWEKNATPAPAETARALEAELSSRDARIRELEHRLTIEAAKDRAPATIPEPTPAVAAKAKKPWFDRHGPKIAMYAAVGLSASGEYALACLAGFYAPVAALLPIAMDVYVIQAMRRRRDVAAALILAVAANALDRLAEARLFGVDRNGAATWWLIVSVVAIAPFIVWRIHRITEAKTETAATPKSEPDATPKSEPEVPAAPKPEVASAPKPEAVPEVEVEVAPKPKSEAPATPKPEVVPEAEVAAAPKSEAPRPSTSKPKRPTPKSVSPNPKPAPLGGQRAKKAAQVEAVLEWMVTGGGPKSVPMRRIEEHFGLPTTTAYDRWKTAGTRYFELHPTA
jgi:hypothetical protein